MRDHQIMWLKSKIPINRVSEIPHQQDGANQHDHRQRNLAGDECRPQAGSETATRNRPGCFPQRAIQVNAGASERWHQAEHNPTKHCKAKTYNKVSLGRDLHGHS